MSQWGQGQPGYQYPLQTGFPGQNQTFQQPGFQGGLAPQPTGFPGQRPPFQQPQQTGFPGAGPGLLPQQTGFPGSFQQRPPIPPVPPLPSQFQQQPPPLPPSSNLLAVGQQNRFASSSPAFGGSGLGPQQFGYPGQSGGGLQPLAHQITGFVDPRLQMMSSTFLPANLSAPYNPAGAPQLLQPQQQLGGLSLQQSFQQHNQEVKGTLAPAVPWTLSKGEKKSYDQIFRAWDASNTGFIDGRTAIEVFGQSGLDRNDLARVWTLADVDNRGKLNIAEFHVAMGLIYRKLNGNEIPDELPAELVPPSHRDLDTSVNFVKNLLQNEPSRARSPSGLDAPVSRLPNRSLHSSSAPGAGGRQDATVYKHTDEEPAGGYYTPRSRHVDRSAVRASAERDSPSADLNDMKRRLENTARMLDQATEESALHTAEDDALDREMSDLKWKVNRVQEDLEYVSRGPRSRRADEDRRRLERELLDLMHDRVPAVEKKLAEREERRERQKRERDRERDRRNETFGRFDDRDRDRDRYGGSYSRNDDRDRYGSSYDTDRDRDRDYRDDHSRDFDRDRDRSYRDRSRSRDREYERERKRSPVAARSPPPLPPAAAPVGSISKPPPAPPAPGRSPAPNTKNMTPEERRAFIQAEAQRRTAERMAAMGLSAPPSSTTPKPTLDTSTEDRLAREKREAEEKARAAEEAATERARQRDERLRNERGASTPASPPAATPPAPAAPAPRAPPPVKSRAPAPPPPRKPSQGIAVRAPVPPKPVAAPAISKPVPPPAPRAIDHEEEELRAREEALRKQKEERLARLRRLDEEEKEEEANRQREEVARLQREQDEAARKEKQERLERLKRLEEEEAEEAKREEEAREVRRTRTPAPVAPPAAPAAPPVPQVPTPPATAVGSASPADRGKHNPFNRLISGGVPSAPPAPPAANGGNNPFFRSQPTAPPTTAPTATVPAPPPAPPAFVPPPTSKSPAPPVIKTSYHTAPGDSEDEWGQEKDDDDDSSEDELNSSRDTRDRLARQLFGSILPPASGPPRPQSAAAGSSTAPQVSTPTAFSVPTTPPPPPPAPPAPLAPAAPPAPIAPPPPAAAAPAPAGDRNALLSAIQSGARLRKAVTNDRSGSALSGRVIGDAGPPPHVSVTASDPPPEISHADPGAGVNSSRQSVDWYMGFAADQGPHASREPSLPSMGEEEEEEVRKEANGHAASVPDIQIAPAEEAQSDPLADVDRSTEYRVRSLYPYDGQRPEDLTFAENLVIIAHPSKAGGDWWYGTVASSGKAGFFPKTYVQDFETVEAKGLYDYPAGSADELPFSEGDVISIVDRSDSDWYKAEKDGVIFIVPSAYLEITEDTRSSSSKSMSKPSPQLPSSSEVATSKPSEAPSSSPSQSVRVPQDDMDEARDDETASDGHTSVYHSFPDSDSDSDSDTEDDETDMTEEERRLEHETRAAERQLVLEAAGIVVVAAKRDEMRPRPPLRRVQGPRPRPTGEPPKRRPPPALPSPASVPGQGRPVNLDKPQPPPPTRHLDDAYERYEAFKQQASRASVSSFEQMLPPASPVSVISFASRETYPGHERDRDRVKEGGGVGTSASTSALVPSSYGSRISQLLTRSRTPVQDREARVMPTISAPILSTSSSAASGTLGTPEEGPAFGSSWASLVDKSALEGLPDRERRRQEAIFELVATEGAYVRDLQLIVGIFYSSMLDLLETKAITVIFANVEDILLTNTTFLSSLEERQRSCRLYIDNIGDILDKYLTNMTSSYRAYCVNQANAIRTLQSLRDRNADLAAHLQHLREDPAVRNLDLSSYLLVPMQRITRYPLLIKQIIQYTEPDEDRMLTEHALHTAERILKSINEAIREQEGRERLKVLSEYLWLGQGRLDLTAPTRHLGDRKLLREGLLTKAKSGRKLRVILCNDILLLTDEPGKTLYRMPIPLTEIRVDEAPRHRDEVSFQLSIAYPRGGDKITLRASSPRERHHWMTEIEMTSLDCRKAEKAASSA